MASSINNKKTFYSVLFISVADMVALCLCVDTDDRLSAADKMLEILCVVMTYLGIVE